MKKNLINIFISIFLFASISNLFSQSISEKVSNKKNMITKFKDFLVPGNEIKEFRTEQSIHYRINDSTAIGLIYSGNKYYKNINGEYQEFQNEIINLNSTNNTFTNKNGKFKFYFEENFSLVNIIDLNDKEVCQIGINLPSKDYKHKINDNKISLIPDNNSFNFEWIINNNKLTYIINSNVAIAEDDLFDANYTIYNEQNSSVYNIKESQKIFNVDNDYKLILNHAITKYFDTDYYRNKKINFVPKFKYQIIGELAISENKNINAFISGRVLKTSSGSYQKYSGYLWIQNTSSSGCSEGYRSYVKYNLSSIPTGSTVTDVDQYVYAFDLNEGWSDYLNYDIFRLDVDPANASASSIWNNISSGQIYENDEWVSSPPNWEWSDIPAENDINDALSAGWFALGYMVDCYENDNDYSAKFYGAWDSYKPYLAIMYNLPPKLTVKPKYAPILISPSFDQTWKLYIDGAYIGTGVSGNSVTKTLSPGYHTFYGKVQLGNYTSKTKVYSINLGTSNKDDDVWWNKVKIKVKFDGQYITSGYSLSVYGQSQNGILDYTLIGDEQNNIPIKVTYKNESKTKYVSYSSFGITDQVFEFTNPPNLVIASGSISHNLGDVLQGQNPSPSSYTFVVKNSGGGTLTGNISKTGNWISISPTSFSLVANQSKTITVTATTSNLSTGNHSAQINVTSNGGNKSGTATVNIKGPELAISGSISNDFGNVKQGQNPSPNSYTFVVKNVGGGTLTGNISKTGSWISISPTSFSLSANQSKTITVTAITNNLSTGNYSAQINVSSNGGSTSGQATVNVINGPKLCVDPIEINLGDVQSGDDPGSISFNFTITNCGGGTISGNINANDSWISISPTSFSLAANQSIEITGTANTSSLSDGNHCANISLNTSLGNLTVTICINIVPTPPLLIIITPPDLYFDLGNVDFEEDQYGDLNANIKLGITNGGGSELQGSVSFADENDPDNCVSLPDPINFYLSSNETQTFSDSFTISRPSENTFFNCTIKVESNGGSVDGTVNISSITGVKDFSRVGIIPKDFFVKQNYPNPFNPTTVLRFGLPEESNVKLIVYDIKGVEVSNLITGKRFTAGTYEYQFDGKDLSSGIYFYVLTAQSTISEKHFRETGKMMLVK